MRKLIYSFIISFLSWSVGFGQNIILEGTVIDKSDQTSVSGVFVRLMDKSGSQIQEIYTDNYGRFSLFVPLNKEYFLDYEKKMFAPKREKVSTKGEIAGDKLSIKTELESQSGYGLDITLVEKKSEKLTSNDKIQNARIEVYNHTKKRADLVIESLKSNVFNVNLQQGHEYTILVRKEGFYSKRLHVNVNVNGCYLCMDGFGTINPGVESNLFSEPDNKLGNLTSTLALEPIEINKNSVIPNIYYEYNSTDLTKKTKSEFNKVIELLKINPSIVMELSAHTDSRGSDDYNLQLSQQRAQSAVDYITASGLINPSRLKAKGYGETKLINKCDNGVPCNDNQHLQNRRIELKIVGLVYDAFSNKSLEQMILDEQNARLEYNNDVPTSYSYTQPITKNLKEKSIYDSTPSVSKRENLENIYAEPFDEPYASNRMTENRKPSKLINIEPFEEENSAQNNSEVPNQIIKNKKTNLLPLGNYSGYKIELFTSDKLLNVDNDEIKMVTNSVTSDIFFDIVKAGEISYLIGHFQGWAETNDYLEKVKYKYPKAKIIEYYNGKRLEN